MIAQIAKDKKEENKRHKRKTREMYYSQYRNITQEHTFAISKWER
jgi:hypothetical protein